MAGGGLPLARFRHARSGTIARLSWDDSLQRIKVGEDCDSVIKNFRSYISYQTKTTKWLKMTLSVCWMLMSCQFLWRVAVVFMFPVSPSWSVGNFYRIVKSPRREGKTLLILLNWWSETNPPAPDTTAKFINFNNKEIICKC